MYFHAKQKWQWRNIVLKSNLCSILDLARIDTSRVY